ncbi:SDR family NAD(P)-dependent oxidoreductase [Aestuariimicrobium kwangyangense]|uniref:SDR family NAD(P)-dependent oxidoreductase n=1 Tax=Aestuariimicrobium kwangyangense TaxID=396389 RepID=UPI0003B45B7D|nr:SDR family oxidoreductase [Aestuariimicrobium kwangyangense]
MNTPGTGSREPGAPEPGSWALVTGASGGLGEAFVDHLATKGVNVVVTGRRADALERTAQRARAKGVEAVVLTCDLGVKEERDELVAEISRRGLRVQTLVNNAGFGTIGDFAAGDPARHLEKVRVNCEALTDLTQRYLPGMLQQHRGTIINVSSTASFQPLPGMAVYAATKAYVRSFSEALWHELKGTGVKVVTLCPGPTETGFFEVAGDSKALGWRRTPEQVVETCFRGLGRGLPTVVDGPLNLAQAVAGRLAPTRLGLAISHRVMQQR